MCCIQSCGRHGHGMPLERVCAPVGRRHVCAQWKGNAEGRRQHGLGSHLQLLQLGLLQPLGLCAPVLEPDLHLCLCQVERARELCTFRNGQVLLLAKLALQGQQLGRGERCARLPVGFVLPQRARRRTEAP
ncbi:hypothetical protein MHYP_G00143750 [Metynnis hypsauchen]